MSALLEAESDLANALKLVEPRTPYVEVMAEARFGHRLRLDKKEVRPEASPRLSGAVFRAWGGHDWVETASSGLDARSIHETADRLAGRLNGESRSREPPGEPATGRGERISSDVKPMADFSVESRVALARDWHGWVMAVPGIDNCYTSIAVLGDERIFLSSAGARRYQRISRAHGSVAALAQENGKVEWDFSNEGGMGGVEVLDRITQAAVLEVAHEAKRLLTAASAPAGRMAVLLDPTTAGTFAHESFGHGTEADQILRKRSYLEPLLGQEVGPETLTLVDDGSYDGGWGSIFFDDEGFPAQRTVLVDRGRFVEVLHDRESAAALHRKPTGNTRRADFLSRPFVRMTNTFVEPGTMSFDELVKEAKDGVLLQHCTSGIEDPLGGNMQIKVKKARRIVHGELGEILPSLALSGRVLEFLRSIRGISKASDFEMNPGFCGKGHTDILPAGTGGSYLLAEAVVGAA